MPQYVCPYKPLQQPSKDTINYSNNTSVLGAAKS